jgi:uncharacterized protein
MSASRVSYIKAIVTPKSRSQEIKKVDKKLFKIKLVSPPKNGQANLELIDLLASFCNIKKNQVSIVSGHRSRIKLIKFT